MKGLVLYSLLLCILFCSTIFAQLEKYPTYEEYLSIMAEFETNYPDLCRIEEFGTTTKGRKLLAAKVSDNVTINEAEPEFLYVGAIHGRETGGFIFLLRLIDTLLTSYASDTGIQNLVSNIEIWINPVFNADDLFEYNPNPIIDLDRNFPRTPGAGASQTPEKETLAMIAFVEKYNFIMGAVFHAGIESCVYPFHGIEPYTVDDAWYQFVGREFADTAQTYGPSGYMNDCNNGICNGYHELGYIAMGTMNDWLHYFERCRNLKIEISAVKLIDESQLNIYWESSYRSIINYLTQVLNGIRGTVTDTLTGEPLKAKVFIDNHDKDSSHVFSHLPHGDYYRPIYQGTYDVTFSCDGYYSKTIPGVEAKNNEAATLNVKLRKIQIGIIPKINNLKELSISNLGNIKKIEIYDLMGRKLKTLPATSNIIKWKECNGIYIVRLVGKDSNMQFRIMLTK